MNYPNQVVEAQLFERAHSVLIAQVMSDLEKASKSFMDGVGKRVFSEMTHSRLIGVLEKDLVAFGIALRSVAAERREVGAEGLYWDVVDGIYSLIDALGAQWRYITQEVRYARLQHAIEHVKALEAAL